VVDYVNDKNRLYNRSIEKAFGKYTADTKASLERGTAL